MSLEVDFGSVTDAPPVTADTTEQRIDLQWAINIGVVQLTWAAYKGVALAPSAPHGCLSTATTSHRQRALSRYKEKRARLRIVPKSEQTATINARSVYARSRPRVGGRFVKRDEVGSESEQVL
jgi:hypothetical protein